MLQCPDHPRRKASGFAWHEAGEGDALVLIHGVGLRLEAWSPQIAGLSAKRRVIAVDMPGHGESAPLEKGNALEAFVAWFFRFLDVLDLETVDLAGHSMGALIAGGAVATAPQRIRRVALLNGVYRRDDAARAAVLARAGAIETHGTVDIEGPLARWFGEDATSQAAREATRGFLSRMDPQAYATAYRAFAEGDAAYADHWPDVQAPALFLTGDGDPNSTPDMARQMAALAPRGVARIIEGHRHMVNLTAPDAVNASLADWLEEETA
ncbi:alpha/beta fold hydrolase [Allorhizobium sp. BGMRC 0089]|uniref:alpha/beta fold hydrolase n=1 Tax=Allorhizobium sonneratiae TaxID=2934936 RepID=UPI002033D8AD|nr:alpha/beta fold hydrolase [Allorhizobium sonneratiae]MCM2293970.1 alpha/beta fold hydrolase [Allorhizobium sonneratiae]